MRVIGYCRKSPNGASDEGTGLDYQAQAIRDYCAREGLELVGEIYEDLFESGKNMDRPGFKAALEALAGVDGLVIWKLSRMTRSVRDLFELLDGPLKAKALHSVSEKLDTRSAMGRFVVSILGSVAQLEREIISENTTAALAHKRKGGCYLGGIAYGWRRVKGADGKLTGREFVAAEQAVIARVRRMMREGVRQPAIAEQLNADGVTAPKGEHWTRRSVQRVLEQPEA